MLQVATVSKAVVVVLAVESSFFISVGSIAASTQKSPKVARISPSMSKEDSDLISLKDKKALFGALLAYLVIMEFTVNHAVRDSIKQKCLM